MVHRWVPALLPDTCVPEQTGTGLWKRLCALTGTEVMVEHCVRARDKLYKLRPHIHPEESLSSGQHPHLQQLSQGPVSNVLTEDTFPGQSQGGFPGT